MFKYKFYFLSVLFLTVLLVGCQIKPVKMVEVVIGQQTICAEVADQPAQREQGLSGRPQLAADRGMLFVFPQSNFHSFWMKGMNFPLDIIWINNNQIVEVWPNAPVPNGNPIPSHQPKNLANYVLEVSAGSLEKYGWRLGDTAKINLTSTTCQTFY
jgi:uncharacterized membrane protein (UPF0127 family)